MKLKSQYDKMLHVFITFALMCFLYGLMRWYSALGVVIVLQVGKIVWNYKHDYLYHPAGDIVANVAGYGMYWLYAGMI